MGTRVVAVHGLSVLSRIYRRSGKGCAFREPNQLLIYPSNGLISVTCVLGMQKKLRKSSPRVPWARERRCHWGGNVFEPRPKASICVLGEWKPRRALEQREQPQAKARRCERSWRTEREQPRWENWILALGMCHNSTLLFGLEMIAEII